MQKILVTGGMGYIGSHTIVELLAHKFEPIIVDNLSNSSDSVLENLKELTGRSLHFENVDLSDERATKVLFEKYKDCVGVIHFAALKAVGESVEKPLLYYKNNLCSLIHVLDNMKRHKIKNFIFSSSCTVYGEADDLPVTELSSVKAAESPYGNTKQIGEEIIRETTVSNKGTLSSISLRYFNPVGAHESGKIGELPIGVPKNLMPFITQTAAGLRDQLQVFGNDYDTPDGTCIRDYIHVADLAEAHVIALKRLLQNKNENAYEVFNLGTGNGYSVLEVIQSFEKSTGQKVNYKIADRRSGDIVSMYADTKFAFEKLGWKTKRSIDDMTSSAWNWEKNIRGIK